jgi:predicted nucleic acid-binding protein
LDTNIIIYSVEYSPRFTPKAKARLTAVNGERLITCEITQMVSEVYPHQLNDAQLLADCEDYLAKMRASAITPAASRRAACIRARYRLTGLASLHLAAAADVGAERFLTNDHRPDAFEDLAVEYYRNAGACVPGHSG